ncbi:MAG: hypothetical protein LBD08_02900 [Treponema sp.]|nr:hypothetical protein [Treponema sp.]
MSGSEFLFSDVVHYLNSRARLAKKPSLLYHETMTAIQQTVEIDPSRRILRLEKPLPESVRAGRADIVLVLRDDVPGSHPEADDVYSGLPSGLPDDLVRSQIDLLEKVEW